MESTLLPGALSDSSLATPRAVAGGAGTSGGLLEHCATDAASAKEFASLTDGVLASIDSRLKALQVASSRLQGQMDSQQTSFGLLMDAIGQLQSGDLFRNVGSMDSSSPLQSSGGAVSQKAPRKTWTAVRMKRPKMSLQFGCGQDIMSHIKKPSIFTTPAAFGPEPADGVVRVQSAPTVDIGQRRQTAQTIPDPQRSSWDVTAVEGNAQEPPDPSAAYCEIVPSVGLPIACRLSGGSGSEASQSESEASPSREHNTTSIRSRKSSKYSDGPSPPQGPKSVTFGQQAASDSGRGTLGGFRSTQLTTRGVSRVQQVLEGRAEDVARAAILGAGNTLLDDEVDIPRFILPAQSPVHVAIAALMIVAIVYTGLLSPIVVAYFHSRGISPSSSILMYVADSLWLIFILIVFRSAVYDERGGMIVDARQIAARYLRTWLFMDLLSAWPAFLAPEGTSAYSTCMLLKLLRTPRLAPLISLFQKEYQGHVLTPLKWGLMILLLAHSMACFWRLVQCDIGSHMMSGGDQDRPDLYCEGSYWWHMYVSDMYWMTMTLSTVGYGDIHPYNSMARVFAIFMMFLSPIFFGSVVAALSNVMDKLFDDTVESSVTTMSRFMRRHRVPLGLQRRVERSLRQVLNSEASTSPLDPELFARLSPALQRTFSFAILNGTIGRFPLFRGAIHSCVAELAQAHMLVHCSAGDLVGEAGQLVEDLVFVVNGELVASFSWSDRFDVPVEELAQASDAQAHRLISQTNGGGPAPTTAGHSGKRRILGKGAWFGESCVVNRQHVRTANFTAQGVSELAVLNKEEYMRVMNRYPAMMRRHERFVEELDDGTISFADISWTAATARMQRTTFRASLATRARSTRMARSTFLK